MTSSSWSNLIKRVLTSRRSHRLLSIPTRIDFTIPERLTTSSVNTIPPSCVHQKLIALLAPSHTSFISPKTLNMDDDEFGLSSADEVELLNLEPIIATNGKRKNESEDPLNSTKKLRIDLDDAPSSSPAVIATANRVLKQRFGLNAFRLKQEAAITRVLDGGSSVVVFPTGKRLLLLHYFSNIDII